VEEFPLVRIFGEDGHADFHRSVKDPVDAGFQDDHFAQSDRMEEIEPVHRRGNYGKAAVPAAGDGGDDVDPVHEATSEEVAEGVGIVRQHHLGHFGGRC